MGQIRPETRLRESLSGEQHVEIDPCWSCQRSCQPAGLANVPPIFHPVSTSGSAEIVHVDACRFAQPVIAFLEQCVGRVDSRQWSKVLIRAICRNLVVRQGLNNLFRQSPEGRKIAAGIGAGFMRSAGQCQVCDAVQHARHVGVVDQGLVVGDRCRNLVSVRPTPFLTSMV